MKIWERYFLKETLKGFFFFLFAFASLYILIDFASHTGSLHHHHTKFNFTELALFYIGELIRRSDVMIPFALIVATIRTITGLNVNNEWVALLASGIPMKRLMRPFLYVALLAVSYLYINEEIFLPWSMQASRELGERYTVDQALKTENAAAHHLILEDGTMLVFQNFDRSEKKFFDVWWIRSINEMWRIKYLTLDRIPFAEQVEVFMRGIDKALVSTKLLATELIPELKFNQKRLLETLTPPEDLSITELIQKIDRTTTSEKQSRVETALLRKLLLPWLALLVVIGSAPLCMVFSRNLNVFKIFALSLFGLVFFYLMMNAGTTLADRQVFTPFVSLFIPFAMIALILGIRWFRLI